MATALVQVCVDNRLNHELIRMQVKQHLAASYIRPDRIFVLNEIGGNLGQNLVNTAQMLVQSHETIVQVAILHHDDCLADKAGLRKPLAGTLEETANLLAGLKIKCPLVSGSIYTHNNHIVWHDMS